MLLRLWMLTISMFPLSLPLDALPPSTRPAVEHRKFRSRIVDETIARVKPRLKDPAIAVLFENCWPNTLDTTVVMASANDSFVITGDIYAMWLRDSTNQVLPYMKYAAEDAALADMLRGVVMRQLRSIVLDPYANAFNQVLNGKGHQDDARKPRMTAGVFEGKYELDSWAAVMKLSTAYWRTTGDSSVLGEEWLSAMELILNVSIEQQQSTAEWSNDPPYRFKRGGCKYPKLPVKRTNMIRSAFRPSDDITTYDFLVPSNFMAAVAFKEVAATALHLKNERATTISTKAMVLSDQLFNAAAANATIESAYAYEVDGLGHSNVMDDANVPSLLSLPYIGAMNKEDPTYMRTRKLMLSSANPYFFKGTVAAGIGSPHTTRGFIWPMSLIIQALTSIDDREILLCLNYLKAAAEQTGFMHESFNASNASQFSRPWFAWANALFGELILTLVNERPHLVLNDVEVIV
eukprot:TRINITY_DN64044_c0_g1_i1.p1 TRINITY_DN64044_c0_g1~~TRINITY_DN64044_c0_g1_i1.p1  ORF type:complete len:463 (-),score=36.73 TRINITY_DN64044_c0_g1_i1:130-1518(-)